MKPGFRLVLAATLACSAAAHAAEPLTQTTISVRSAGKEVAAWAFPIGAKVELSAVGNTETRTARGMRFTGNVMGRIIAPAGETIVYGDDIELVTADISPEHARAVHDLEAMTGPDQQYRGRMAEGRELTQDEWKLQTAIDVANMRRLAQILDTFGWPGVRFAGRASQTAFLVLQHADHDSQRTYLPLLRDAVKRNDALGAHLAMLEDRVRLADGKKQLYGTQLSGNPPRFDPIEDEARVDARRAAIGLPPLAEYAKMFGVSYPTAP